MNRVTSAQDIAVNNPGTTKSTATITLSGTERSNGSIWDSGTVSVTVNGVVVGSVTYTAGSTASSVAWSLVGSINKGGNPYVRASQPCYCAMFTLTSLLGGAEANYSLSASSATSQPSYFSGSSFTATPSGSTMTGGSGSAPSSPMSETYAYDQFGNLTQSGNAGGFSQSYNALNQITGYSYDANGDQNTNISGYSLAFDANGMLSSVAGGSETYTYDAQGNRAEVHGAAVTDYVYFGGTPIAMLSGGSYTDLIYAGGALLAEVAGTQNAVPTYRMLNNLGSPTSVDYAAYGQTFAGGTSDSFGFTGLVSDGTTATWHATFRQFSPQQGRWQSPDPYEGSYNWADPQSLNRYVYVNGRPMYATDPSGQFALCRVTSALGVLATGGPIGPRRPESFVGFLLWVASLPTRL